MNTSGRASVDFEDDHSFTHTGRVEPLKRSHGPYHNVNQVLFTGKHRFIQCQADAINTEQINRISVEV